MTPKVDGKEKRFLIIDISSVFITNNFIIWVTRISMYELNLK